MWIHAQNLAFGTFAVHRFQIFLQMHGAWKVWSLPVRANPNPALLEQLLLSKNLEPATLQGLLKIGPTKIEPRREPLPFFFAQPKQDGGASSTLPLILVIVANNGDCALAPTFRDLHKGRHPP